MRLESTRQWHWMIISLVLGAAIGYVRSEAASDMEARFGESINSQSRFEQAVLASEQGRPCFTGISVHSCSVPDGKGGTKHVNIVSGSYFNGQYTQDGGKLAATWQPAFFIAETPYRPATDLSRLDRPELVAQFRSIARPTVLDFLNLLAHARGISYTHAWWLGIGAGTWVLASFLLVGVAWPIAINLMLYGSLRRPPEEKGIDLSKVTKPPAAAPAQPSEEDLDRLRELEAELEAAVGPIAPQATAPASPAREPAKQLVQHELEPVASQTAAETEYRSKKDDYYPTARGPAHKES